MHESEIRARLGVERTSKKKREPLDRLTRDVLAAQEAGMSYGKWKALHPHTGEEENEPEELIVDPSKRVLVCIKCGKTFLASNRQANQKYCSDACKYQQQLDRMRELHPERFKPRKCQVCGKTLDENNKGVYCSSACRQKAWRERDRKKHPEKYEPRPCPICGKLWVPHHGFKYCSLECIEIANKQRSRERGRKRRENQKEAAANGNV
jgi:predicted nucleic acid-binding Zn ribbon protein